MPSCSRRNKRGWSRRAGGFTLLEALCSLLVLGLIFAALAQYLASVDQSWKRAATDPFVEAEEAFDAIAQNLSVATLEPYRDYADQTGAFRGGSSATFTPYALKRRSDLDFVCDASGGPGGLLTPTGRVTVGSAVFFASPSGLTQTFPQEGMGHLLNALGYFVEFGSDTNAPGFWAGPARLRWRLKQVVQPTEGLQVFSTTTSTAWIGQIAGTTATTAIMAENVIALIILPERTAADPGAPLAPAYAYDSRNAGNALTFSQLPPRLHLVLAAIDEASACRLATAFGTAPPSLLPAGTFQDATQLPADINTLDAALTGARIQHRILQRDIALTASAWSNSP